MKLCDYFDLFVGISIGVVFVIMLVILDVNGNFIFIVEGCCEFYKKNG